MHRSTASPTASARQELDRLCWRQQARIVPVDCDHYDRTVARVQCQGHVAPPAPRCAQARPGSMHRAHKSTRT